MDLSPLHDMLRSKKSPQDALQCLDIVLRNAPSNNCIIAGRCFFTPPRDAIIPLGEGMEMYYGFYQSAIRGWKPLLNVDVAHKAFPKALELLDLICELGSDYRFTMERKDLRGRIHDNVLKSVEKFIKQLKVKYEIKGQSSSKRIYRVNGFGDSPSQARFKLEDGTTTTVEKYFEVLTKININMNVNSIVCRFRMSNASNSLTPIYQPCGSAPKIAKTRSSFPWSTACSWRVKPSTAR